MESLRPKSYVPNSNFTGEFEHAVRHTCVMPCGPCVIPWCPDGQKSEMCCMYGMYCMFCTYCMYVMFRMFGIPAPAGIPVPGGIPVSGGMPVPQCVFPHYVPMYIILRNYYVYFHTMPLCTPPSGIIVHFHTMFLCAPSSGISVHISHNVLMYTILRN